MNSKLEQLKEYAKIIKDAPYALKTYLQTYDNTQKKYVPLELFPDQIQLIQDYENYNENEYFLLFHNIHPILIYSNNEGFLKIKCSI